VAKDAAGPAQFASPNKVLDERVSHALIAAADMSLNGV
jgi:hypothetical protein